MRDIVRELYCACSLLRRRGVPRKGAPDAPLCIRMAGERALAANSSQSRIVVAHGSSLGVGAHSQARRAIRHQGFGPPSRAKSRP